MTAVRAQRSASEVSPGSSAALSRPAARRELTASHSAAPGVTVLTSAVQVISEPPESLLGTVTVTCPGSPTCMGSPSPGSGCSPGPVTTYAAPEAQMCQAGCGRPWPGTDIQTSPARLVASAMRADLSGSAAGWISLT